MTWLEIAATYMAVAMLVLVITAVRSRDHSVVAGLVLCWPVLIVLVPWVLAEPWIEKRTPFRVDVMLRRDLSAFGHRARSYGIGHAYRAFWIEFQWWLVEVKK